MAKLLIWLWFTTAYAGPDCTQHPVLCGLNRVAPGASPELKFELSNAIHRHRGTLPWQWLVALAAQETSVRAVHVDYPDGHSDLGVFQINSRTAAHFNCDVTALRAFDVDASTQCAVRVLRRKLQVCLAQGVPLAEAVGCYHSYTPTVRARYVERLQRWLDQLPEVACVPSKP